MPKFRRKILFLTLTSMSLMFVVSCSSNFDYTNTVDLKGEFNTYGLKFVFNKFIKTAGIIKDIDEYNKFISNAEIESKEYYKKLGDFDALKERVTELEELKTKFIELNKYKYNEEFFKENDLVFHQGSKSYFNFLDSVILKDNKQLVLNYVDIDSIKSEIGPSLNILTMYTNLTTLVAIPKGDYYDNVIINQIDTVRKFRSFKRGVHPIDYAYKKREENI